MTKTPILFNCFYFSYFQDPTFLKLHVILGNLTEDIKKIADALLILSSTGSERIFSMGSVHDETKSTQLRKPTNLLSVFTYRSKLTKLLGRLLLEVFM